MTHTDYCWLGWVFVTGAADAHSEECRQSFERSFVNHVQGCARCKNAEIKRNLVNTTREKTK